MSVAKQSERAPRLDRASRREQLLVSARQLVSERGTAALTMEALAAAAGVNKAIPYRHFDNAQAVLVELFRDFNEEIARRVLEASDIDAPARERVRALVRAYLDCVRDNADLLSVLAVPGSSVADASDGGQRAATAFTVRLLCERFGITERDAWAMASAVQGALAGGVDTLAHGEASRRRVESVLVDLIAALVDKPGT